VHLCSVGSRGSAGAGVPPAVHELRHGQATHSADIPAQGKQHLSFSVSSTLAGKTATFDLLKDGALLLHLHTLVTRTSHFAVRDIPNGMCKDMRNKPHFIALFTWLAALSSATVIRSFSPLSRSTRIDNFTFNVNPDMLTDTCRLWLGCGVLPILFSVTSSTCPFSSQLRHLHFFWASTWRQQSHSWLRNHLDLLQDVAKRQLQLSLQGKALMTRMKQPTWRAVMHNYLETVRHLRGLFRNLSSMQFAYRLAYYCPTCAEHI